MYVICLVFETGQIEIIGPFKTYQEAIDYKIDPMLFETYYPNVGYRRHNFAVIEP